MAEDQAGSYFLDAYCPLLTTFRGAGSVTNIDDVHAYAATVVPVIEKTMATLQDPGAKWPPSVAMDVATVRESLQGTSEHWTQVQSVSTMTALGILPQPTSNPEVGAAADRLSTAFGFDLGASDLTKCDGHG